MSRTRVHSSIMASTAVAVLALLAASAVLAAPADRDTEGVAVADTPDKPTQAMLYEAADSDTASNKKDRKKKQTTTICVQVSPGRPGHAPAVLCGDKDDVDEQKRRFEMQRLLQTPVVQLQQQQPGYFGSPHVVQIVPASDSVTVEAPGQSRADTVVVGSGAPATQGTFTFTAPLYRAADAAGQQQAQPSAQHSAQQAQPPQPAGVRAESKPATLEGHSLSGAFAATAPPMPAATAADHANKPQARSFGQDEIVVSQSGSGYGYGVHGPQQVTTVVTGGHDGYNMHGGASEVKVISGVQPGGFSSSMGSLGSLGYNQQPPMIGGMGMNYRAAEVAAAQPAALQQQQQQQQQQQANAQAANAQAAKTLAANAQAANAQAANAQAANAQAGANAASQQRTALLLQQPVVVRKEVVIPAVGSSLLTVQPAAQVRLPTLPEFLNPVSPLSGLGHLSPLATAQPLPQRADVRQQHTGQASIPITLNCDLSTLQYRGSPQQQLQLNLAQPGLFVTNARAAEKDLTDPLKQTLGAAMDAAVRNSTVTVHLNGSPAQANDLPKLQEELLKLQQSEKNLHETIEALKAAGSTHPDHAAAVVGLEHTAAQITKARAAVEQAIMQSGDAAAGARAADALGDAQSMTPAGLQDRMRSSAQFRYFPDPNLAIGPSSTVAVEMSPNVHGVFPRPHEKTTIVTTSSSNFGNPMGLGVGSGLGVSGGFGGGFGGSQHYGGGYRAAAPQPAQQQPQPAQQQPQPAQTQFQPAQQQPAQQRDEPLIQPAVPGSSSATQQKLLQQLREAQEDLIRMRAAAPPRDEPRQAAGNTNLNPTASPVGEEDFPATPGYQYLPKAAEAVPSQAPSQASFTMTTGPVSFSSQGNANGPAFLPAPESPKTHSARQASRYWRR